MRQTAYITLSFLLILIFCFLAMIFWASQEPPEYIPVTDYRTVQEAHKQADECLSILDDAWILRAKIVASIYAWENHNLIAKGF